MTTTRWLTRAVAIVPLAASLATLPACAGPCAVASPSAASRTRGDSAVHCAAHPTAPASVSTISGSSRGGLGEGHGACQLADRRVECLGSLTTISTPVSGRALPRYLESAAAAPSVASIALLASSAIHISRTGRAPFGGPTLLVFPLRI